MWLKKALFFVFFLAVSAPVLQAQITSQDIQKALNKNLQHPYLYFTGEEKPAILERIKNDPECRDIIERMLAEANRYLYTPVNPQAPMEEKNTRYYSNGEYDNYYYSNRNAAFSLAFVYQMTGDRKYAQKAFEFAEAVCDLQTWVIRAHEFPIIYSRVMPWNVPDDQVNFTFDHVTGDTARMMAAVYDWLYTGLDKPQRDRIRGALLEKAITRVRGNYEYHWWAVSYRCNWCGVCNSGLGLAALALLTEDPKLTDVVAESYNRIGNMLGQIDQDGGWQEGCGYWYYGVHTSVYFADALKRLTGGQYNLFNHPRLKTNTVNFPLYCYIPPNKTVDFEDSGGGMVGASFFYNKLAAETGSREAAWFSKNLMRSGGDVFDILWPKSSVAAELPRQTSLLFRGIDWAVMRSDFTDPGKVMVACKAGFNNDPHHGHLDCGHFILYWNGQGYVAESGHSAYDEKYFDAIRYEYPQASSIGHNVVFVNGEKQIIAKLKDQPMKEGIGGRVLQFRTSNDRDYTLMDPTHAYPNRELKGWRRHITLEKPLITVVLDEVKSAPGAEIEARFHSEVTQRAKKGYMLLEGGKGDMALIPVVEDEFSFRPGKHAILAVQKTAAFKWVPYIGTVLKATKEDTVMAAVILPVANDAEAEGIVKSVRKSFDGSGNYTLSFAKSGKTYTYKYKKGPDGLVME
ncbi:MAG: heparinase II/III family protein [Candidatus Latescibacter sp.]|nr:heparinase II/III family protein [Candidatus Latescibacter sp.]